jgi:sulfite oxidase
MPVNSVIGFPESGDTVRVGPDEALEAKGYALPHSPDGPVVKVEVSVDGVSWEEAELSNDPERGGRRTWVLWQARVKLSIGKHRRILSQATDKGGNMQEKDSVWNLRGVAYNDYGEVRDLNVEAN